MFTAKGRRITEMNREAAQRKFGMNMDREADFFLFGRLLFDRRRMKLINAVVRKECAHFALETVRYRGGISKACGTA